MKVQWKISLEYGRPLLAAVMGAWGWMAAGAGTSLLRNGGFETVGPKGIPQYWKAMMAPQPTWTSTQTVRSGHSAGQLLGDGKEHFLRQVVSAPESRVYTARGWFRGKDIRVDSARGEYIHFYVHVLYKGHPYRDTSHFWRDPPTGAFAWRPLTVRVSPRPGWRIRAIWVTVAGKFSKGSLWFDDVSLTPAAQLAGSTALEWSGANRAQVLSDMRACRPASALSATGRRGYWRTISYDTGTFHGTMIWADFATAPPAVRLALPVRGWYAIFLGMFKPGGLESRLWVKLSRDAAPVARQARRGPIEEILFKVAKLNQDELVIRAQSRGNRRGGGLAYVKLVPLTAAERQAWQSDRAKRGARRLVTSLDGFSFIYDRAPITREMLLAETAAYQDSDFDLMILQMGCADQVNYPSQVGELLAGRAKDFARPGDEHYARAVRELARKGINPTRVLIQGAHQAGMRVHVAVRPAAWIHTAPMDEFYASKFYLAHPEWRCRDRDGTPAARLSLAVPQVRRHLTAVLREAVRLGADGANVIFVRGMPVVLFEPAFAEPFKQKYGTAPQKLPPNDPRLLAARSAVVTGFMREIRGMLDDEAKRRKQGKRLELSAYVFADEADNRRFGIDLRAWAAENLVDMVFPYLGAGGGRAKAYDMAFFTRVCSKHGIAVRPTFVTWRIRDPGRLVRDGVKLYEQGADGISFWDANSAVYDAVHWAVVSHFGDLGLLRRMEAGGVPRPVRVRLHSLGGLVLDGRFSPNWGF